MMNWLKSCSKNSLPENRPLPTFTPYDPYRDPSIFVELTMKSSILFVDRKPLTPERLVIVNQILRKLHEEKYPPSIVDDTQLKL